MRCKYIWNREIFMTLQESETPNNELSLAEILLQKDETRIRQAMRLHPTNSQHGGPTREALENLVRSGGKQPGD
jgi:hypothetical protein